MQQFVGTLNGRFPVQQISTTVVTQLLNLFYAADQAKQSGDERLPEQPFTVCLDCA
jgi:hypothetical protein